MRLGFTSGAVFVRDGRRLKENLHRNKGRSPFSLYTTSFNYGEFLVEQGYWLQQVHVVSHVGAGEAKIKIQNLFALQLKE